MKYLQAFSIHIILKTFHNISDKQFKMAIRYHDGIENELNRGESGSPHDLHERWR